MQLDDKIVHKIAQLARLDIPENEHAKLLEDMNRILGFVEKLQEVDTEGVEPLIYMNDEANVFRADAVKEQFPPETALQNAPQHDAKYFRVPKVIRKDV
ncbi:MAG: Asp-tRNA(Asn)/Glu-tRNA(Gln) amidotransferase subunit GatC [Mucilaginibacter polytrichastri]|nr:Asp-tRNA(Asn)/Glu-tRNA(Gln) amidotransferase subunit GatC [Mucilaginibacter polytrichastri]